MFNGKSNYTIDLKGRHILMISDFVTNYTEKEAEEEKKLLQKIKNEISKYKINFHYVEVKNLEELKKLLLNYDKDKIIIFNWCEELEEKPKTGSLVTRFLEENNYLYTGANTECLKANENKGVVKKLLIDNNIPTPRYLILNGLDDIKENILNFPVIVKCATEHSSIGITNDSVVEDINTLKNKVKGMLEQFGGEILVEEFIEGPEIIISIIGNEDPQVLPFIEIDFSKVKDPKNRIQNQASKWEIDSEDYINTPIVKARPLDKKLEDFIKQIAIKSYKVTGCRGFGRMEIRLKDDVPYVIDVNANPALATGNSFFTAAGLAGMNYGETILKICEFALK